MLPNKDKNELVYPIVNYNKYIFCYFWYVISNFKMLVLNKLIDYIL